MTKTNPKVSIIVPCYNHGQFIVETLESIDDQTFRNFEVIIIDDGSDDVTTLQLLDQLARPGIRVTRTSNRGVSAARNRGISEALGPFILALDADDRIGPDYLARAVPVLEQHDDVGVVYGERQLFGERHEMCPLPAYDPRRLLVENLLHSAAVFRKEDWELVGGYNEAMVHGWEDWDFWVALSGLGRRFVKLPDVRFFYRVRGASRDRTLCFSQKIRMYWLMMRRNRRLYLRHLPFVIKSLCRIHLVRHS